MRHLQTITHLHRFVPFSPGIGGLDVAPEMAGGSASGSVTLVLPSVTCVNLCQVYLEKLCCLWGRGLVCFSLSSPPRSSDGYVTSKARFRERHGPGCFLPTSDLGQPESEAQLGSRRNCEEADPGVPCFPRLGEGRAAQDHPSWHRHDRLWTKTVGGTDEEGSSGDRTEVRCSLTHKFLQ